MSVWKLVPQGRNIACAERIDYNIKLLSLNPPRVPISRMRFKHIPVQFKAADSVRCRALETKSAPAVPSSTLRCPFCSEIITVPLFIVTALEKEKHLHAHMLECCENPDTLQLVLEESGGRVRAREQTPADGTRQ
jgi:hypothetical protein